MTTTPHPEDMPEAIKAYEDRYQCSAEDPMCQADLGFFLAGWSASASLAEQRTRAMREALEQALEFIADHEDVRDGDAGPLPNRAMVLATELRASLSTPPSAPGKGEAEGKDAARDVLAERQRQIEREGWSTDHDDNEHNNGELARAALCYADVENQLTQVQFDSIWPWSRPAWKPKDKRRDLVRAAALILAEIERIDRAALPAAPSHPGPLERMQKIDDEMGIEP